MSESQGWPPELDAVVAAPDHHRLLLENEQVRVLETRIDPGESVPLHCHRWPAAYYVLSWSDIMRRGADGSVQLDSRNANVSFEPGSAVWSGSLAPHTLENVGDKPIHIVSIEIKS
jgi:mannose-6-phosphate isomerase-like protein (cupin superfamily)